MSEWSSPLVLASASERRRDLLAQVGIPVEVHPSGADEQIPPGITDEQAVVMVARRKADEVAQRHAGRAVLAADTMVRVDAELLGKPDGPDDARRMLELMSGRWHEVLTGVVLISGGVTHERISITSVRLARLTPAEIDRYIAGPEPYDKAGGYGIQSTAGWFVAEVRGSYTNVMGLPLEQVRDLLADAGLPMPLLGG